MYPQLTRLAPVSYTHLDVYKRQVVKSNIVKGVATLYNIPVSSVMVFEKNQEEKSK